MKLFKKEILNVVKTYTSYISTKTNIPEEELYKLLLIQNKSSKVKKINTTGYIMFVKKMHETCDNNLNFTDKSKLIGNAWCSLTTDKKLEYNKLAVNTNENSNINSEKDYCTFINIKKDKKCNKFICEHNKLLCKKHYKLHLKKMEKSKKIKDITENIIDINKYTNSNVKLIIHDDKEMYVDYFNKLYIIDNNNNASLIGNIDLDGKYIISKINNNI